MKCMDSRGRKKKYGVIEIKVFWLDDKIIFCSGDNQDNSSSGETEWTPFL